jgi:hypothetical protein
VRGKTTRLIGRLGLVVLLVLLLPSCTFFAELFHPIKGTWTGTATFDGATLNVTLTIDRESADELSGTVDSLLYYTYDFLPPGTPLTGTIDKDEVTITITGEFYYGPATVTLSGTLDKDTLSGDMVITPEGYSAITGTFTLTRSD